MEKLKLRSRFALLLLILIAPFAGVSAAGLLDLNNGSSAVDVNTSDHPAINASSQAHVNADTQNTNVNVDNGVNANVNTGNSDQNTNNGTTGQVNSQGAAHADVNALQNANSNSSLQVFSRDDASIMNNIAPEMASNNVQTNADLKSFAATSLRNDDNLNAMGFGTDRVEVAYREPARLLGLIPTSVNVDVVAHQDGTVDISYPWYSFLMLTNRADLDAAIRNEVGAFMSQNNAPAQALANSNGNSALNASTTAATTATSTVMNTNASSNWSASLRAELAARIAAILRAHLNLGTASTTQASY